MAGTIKRASAHQMRAGCLASNAACLSPGYGAFSVSQSHADAVVACIRNQAAHHLKRAFQEEYRQLLQRHHLAFDKRYVWD